MADDDPKADEAMGRVVSALTLAFSGNVPAAELEMEKAKIGVPEETCDFLFGMVANMILQLANGYEVEPLRIVQEIGLNAAKYTSGIEDP